MQFTHLLFTQEEINRAVEDYRERVRKSDSDELKAMLKRGAIEHNLAFSEEKTETGIAILKQMMTQDLEGLFEPPDDLNPSTEEIEDDITEVLENVASEAEEAE